MYLCYSHQDFSTLPFFRSIFFITAVPNRFKTNGVWKIPYSISDAYNIEDFLPTLLQNITVLPSFDPRYTLFFIWSAHWNASVRQYVSQGLLNWPGCTDSHLQKKGLCDGLVYVCRMKALVLKMQEGLLAVKLL